ncbi:MAG: pentapeptide repeat-containing protein, partial [Cyanobacteria bacterium J06628_6]
MTQLTVNEVLAKVEGRQSLRRAELSHINLCGARLEDSNFSQAYLRRANLSGA